MNANTYHLNWVQACTYKPQPWVGGRWPSSGTVGVTQLTKTEEAFRTN